MAVVNVDSQAETMPYFFYRRVAVVAPEMLVSFDVPLGFTYLLKRIVSTWDTTDAGATFLSPQVLVEVIHDAKSRYLQPVPFPLALETSPAGAGVLWVNVAATAVDQDAYGRSLTAKPRKYQRTRNYLFEFRSALRFRLSGMTIVGAVADNNHPSYIDILTEGRLNADRQRGDLWR